MNVSYNMFLANFDFYPKFSDDLRQRTRSGGALAIGAFALMLGLFYVRMQAWLETPLSQRFIVDAPALPFRNGRHIDVEMLPKMAINFDVFLTHVPCSYVSVQVMDLVKDYDTTAEGRIHMNRFDASGKAMAEKPHPKEEEPPPEGYCGPCYSVSSGCCNTCKDVRRAFKERRRPLPPIASIEQCAKEGFFEELRAMANESCRVHGSIDVHQHPGTLHVSPGDTFDSADSDAFAKLGIDVTRLNMSHHVHHFSIGRPQRRTVLPIDGHTEIQMRSGIMKMFYFIRTVPVNPGSGEFAMSVTKFQNYRSANSTKFPGLFFSYDVSPIAVVEENTRSIVEFLIEVSAILGGIFSIASFLDAAAFKCQDGEGLSKVA